MNKNVKHSKKLSTLLWHRLTRVHKDNLKGTNELLNEWNLTNAQMDIISRLGEHRTLAQQELAEMLLVTKGNITQLLGKLEDRYLISRKKDWRTNYISLTKLGQKLYREITPQLENYQWEKSNQLTTEEKKQLLHLLRKLHN
ncbi:MarR family winged helix-turn-helix transcriptional regulator [Lentibacillus amyloliquefaciens]|uniref:HTH marR-type domain-containing protein n=1 Tax=Lentibacillus amyloliquefaciens TaxID=1472767 RepID=A0A0U4GA31_9BACI|nr:MarR family transcriptional regulator [Lentibacillus amyloliquefaciens]ALX49594.1 hypothetical protein AOX59_14075 [Lentibacillus amyloliquefaciens]